MGLIRILTAAPYMPHAFCLMEPWRCSSPASHLTTGVNNMDNRMAFDKNPDGTIRAYPVSGVLVGLNRSTDRLSRRIAETAPLMRR